MNISRQAALFYVSFVSQLRLCIITFFSWLLFKQHNSYKKILVNRDGAFGDSIVAIPAISIIRQNYPGAQIDLLSINNDVVSFNSLGLQKGLVDNLYIVNKKERAEKLRTLKQEGYDLFIQIPQNIGIYKTLRNMLLVRFYLKIKNGFGWDSGRIKSFMHYQKYGRSIPTETQRFINTLRKHGLTGKINYPLLPQTPAPNTLEKLNGPNKPIAFLIGGKLQPKKWPLEHWASLASLIGPSETILLIGGEAETEEAKCIVEQTKNTHNLCGKLTIPELNYVLKNAKIAISLDTGAMHLCDATETKQVVLFSTRDLSNKWFPNHNDSIVIEKVLPCSFCLKTMCDNNICMTQITPKEVYEKVKKLISV